MSESKTPETEHAAWCRYVTQEPRPTRIVLCNSDAPNAFRVYHEHDVLRLEAERDALREALRRYMAAVRYADSKEALMAAIKDADDNARALLEPKP